MNWLRPNRPPLRWLFAVSALSLGLAAGHALADSPRDPPSVKINFADLDLSKQAGAEALYSRIQNAARSMCGRVDSREIERYNVARQCYDETIEAAVKQINLSSLYAVHEPQDHDTGTGLTSGRLEARSATMR